MAVTLAGGGCARRYRVEGMVLQVNAAARTMTVSHREIPGYMPAMVMPFRVRNPLELRPLAPGTRVDFELRGDEARRIRPRTARLEGIDSNESLPLPAPAARVAVGDEVPDFALSDERAQTLRLSDLRGRTVVLQFLYTRCPLPEVCPRQAALFAALQRRLAGDAGLVLLSVTLDPQHDTPEVLRDYARRWRAQPEIWRFLTGAPEDIQRVAGYFGLLYWAEEGMITHTAATAVIARDGRLAALVEGSSYEYRQLADLIRTVMEKR